LPLLRPRTRSRDDEGHRRGRRRIRDRGCVRGTPPPRRLRRTPWAPPPLDRKGGIRASFRVVLADLPSRRPTGVAGTAAGGARAADGRTRAPQPSRRARPGGNRRLRAALRQRTSSAHVLVRRARRAVARVRQALPARLGLTARRRGRPVPFRVRGWSFRLPGPIRTATQSPTEGVG